MTRKELEYFLSVYSTRSITRSAEQLFVTPQALSKTIRKTESELGISLFDRTASGLVPTVEAERLSRHARIIVNEFDSIEGERQDVQDGMLTVAATWGVIEYLGYSFVQGFYEKFPQIRLSLVCLPEKEIENLLMIGEIEIAFLPAPIDDTRFDADYCTSWKHCLLIHKDQPLSKKDAIDYADLAGIPLALRGRSYSVYPSNITHFLKEGVHPHVLLETSSDALILEAAEANAAIGVSLKFLAERLPRKNTVIRDFSDPDCVKEVYLATRKSARLSYEGESFQAYALHWFAGHRIVTGR